MYKTVIIQAFLFLDYKISMVTLYLWLQFGGSEAIITALSDEFPILRKHRELFVAVLFVVYFIVGLSFVAQVRLVLFCRVWCNYLLDFFVKHVVSFKIPFYGCWFVILQQNWYWSCIPFYNNITDYIIRFIWRELLTYWVLLYQNW